MHCIIEIKFKQNKKNKFFKLQIGTQLIKSIIQIDNRIISLEISFEVLEVSFEK